MKLYILAEADYQNYGFGTKNVRIFTSREEAEKEMRMDLFRTINADLYRSDKEEWERIKNEVNAGKEEIIGMNNQLQIHTDYAYLADMLYCDIFERELEITL